MGRCCPRIRILWIKLVSFLDMSELKIKLRRRCRNIFNTLIPASYVIFFQILKIKLRMPLFNVCTFTHRCSQIKSSYHSNRTSSKSTRRLHLDLSDIYIYISSSYHVGSTDIPDHLSPLLPIVHRLQQVFWATSRILT